MLKFDANNWTPSDQTVAAMLSVTGETPTKVSNNRNISDKPAITIGSLFSTYKLKS